MNKKNRIRSIIDICLKMEKRAERIYRDFGKRSKNIELKKFWIQMASEENEHIGFWEDLLIMDKNNIIMDMFGDSAIMIKELKWLNKYSGIMEKKKRLSDQEKFLIAYKMEYYLIHVAFFTLFNFIKAVPDKKSPQDSYEEHLDYFIDMFYKYNEIMPGADILTTTLKQLWRDSVRLAENNMIDPLSKLNNRRGFMSKVIPLAYLAMRNNKKVSFIIFDIDDFKQINDSKGHSEGDRVIQFLSQAIRKRIRQYDVPGRLGGDEFIVFMYDMDRENAQKAAEGLREEMCSAANKCNATISGGIVSDYVKQNIEESVNSMIKKADAKLYMSKKQGKNTIS